MFIGYCKEIRNLKFRISLRLPSISQVDNTKLSCNTLHQRAAPETYPLGSRADDHRLLYGDIIVVNVVKIESSSTTTIHSLFFAKKSRTNSHYSEGE